MLDQAKLAVVAYGEVNGDTGSSTLTNSGVYTTKLGTGVYQIDLSKNPDGSANQQELNQFSDRDLIVVTAINKTSNLFPYVSASNITGSNGSQKEVHTSQAGASAGVDADFSFVIFRTLTPPATGGPA
jgi:hypothetical protein